MSVAVLLWSAEGHLLREDPLTSVAQVPPPLFIKILFYFLHDGLLLPGLIICSPVALVKVLQKPRNNIMWGGAGMGVGERDRDGERELAVYYKELACPVTEGGMSQDLQGESSSGDPGEPRI